MEIFSILLIGISLSLDAFSLSLAYGVFGVNKKQIISCSVCVGILHFIMPLIGYKTGLIIMKYIKINPKFLLAGIFLILLFQMIKNIKENIKYTKLNVINIILFSIFVSIDSFTIGIGLNIITSSKILSCLIFTILSSLFTFVGFFLGKKCGEKLGIIAKIVACFILFILFLTTLL